MTPDPNANGDAPAESADAPDLLAGYVRYALGLIFLVAVFNVCDRTIMAVLAEDIAKSLSLTDRDLGWLMGPAFTTVHLLAGLPIARLADRSSRRTIISVGLMAWSVMTALAGLAQNFGQLLFARMGVGVGEAAGSPPSHALISDYLPPERRARGLSIITVGSLAGMGFGMVAGGLLNELYGWRVAFFAVGIPGVILAGIVWLTLREPPRGHSEGLSGTQGDESALDVIRYLLGRPSYRWLILGACAAGVLSFGKNFWEPTFLRRVYGMGSAEAGTWYFIIGPIPAGIGTIVGATLSDRLGRRDLRWYMWIAAIVNLLSVPFSMLFLLWPATHTLGQFPVAFAFSIAASFITGMWSPAIMAMAQSLSRPHMRAMSAALWSMIFNFVGMGLGPLIVGELSVRFEPSYGLEAIRYALACASVTPLFAAVFMTLSARTLREDVALARDGGPTAGQ